MTRKTALELIRIEVATEGKVTATALRHYLENRIGYSAFQQAIRQGMKVFHSSHA